jgi:hypothetical protein
MISMPDAVLSHGSAAELNRITKSVKGHWGKDIEKRFALAKLKSLVDPASPPPDKQQFFSYLNNKTSPFTNGWLKSDLEKISDTLVDAVDSFQKHTLEILETDWDETKKAYYPDQKMSLPENFDIDTVATNQAEKTFLLEVCDYLGYKYTPGDDGSPKLHLAHRSFIDAPLGIVISAKINVGLINMIETFETDFGSVSRPLLRTVVTLADNLADTWRKDLPLHEAYTPDIAKRL